MFAYRTVSVKPRLPAAIARLQELAHNFWYAWHKQGRQLFKRINEELWEEVGHNPVKFLLHVREDDLQRAAEDEDYLRYYQQVLEDYDAYHRAQLWFDRRYPGYREQVVAYFSAEFGLHESHPIYSGGLGLLAGDHLKSASDLGLPLVGVGLLYKHGYFNQIINREGRQEASYPYHNFFERPMQQLLTPDGREALVHVDLPGRRVFARLWRCWVGRVSLILLDCDISLNSPEDRRITAQLYGGDVEMRICQEIMLGIGGVRALRVLGIEPAAWHINEGHAAFLTLERLRELVCAGLKLAEARELVRCNTLFTTHTPVPAGHDLFTAELIDKYFSPFYEAMGIEREDLLELGWDESRRMFNMTLLAMRLATFCNGVSRLHGQVSRQMFSYLYPGIPVEEIPIGHITNGIHTLTWLAQELKDLYTIYLGEDWENHISDPGIWRNIEDIPDTLLWAVHQSLKEKMLHFARNNIKQQRQRNQEAAQAIKEVDGYLRPDVLTVGFARRFATYKRANLLFHNLERLSRLVNHPQYPVQFVFAGKAHPADVAGQDLIKLIYDISRQEPFRGKIVLLENYDILMARHLVQGVDVWLNTPRRPLEASGTSGQKAAANGVINLSVLDGWWPEGYTGDNGFVVGEIKDYDSEELQDRDDCFSLYAVLEEQILPLYYQHDGGIPKKWVKLMKRSLQSISPFFNTDRMVMEYARKYYVPCMDRWRYFNAPGSRAVQELCAYKEQITQNWFGVQVKVEEVFVCHRELLDDSQPQGYSPGEQCLVERGMHPGEELKILAGVTLGNIRPEQVLVEVVYGVVTAGGLRELQTVPMQMQEPRDGRYLYEGRLLLPQGTYGFTVRVRPHCRDFVHRFELPLVAWAERF
ncbi:MAG: alpha-glucan family phosphorylase [Peptococcaceae bacterium]|nr:alpha-glucan family phosphorylase [Peptococcaceae bacterium]